MWVTQHQGKRCTTPYIKDLTPTGVGSQPSCKVSPQLFDRGMNRDLRFCSHLQVPGQVMADGSQHPCFLWPVAFLTISPLKSSVQHCLHKLIASVTFPHSCSKPSSALPVSGVYNFHSSCNPASLTSFQFESSCPMLYVFSSKGSKTAGKTTHNGFQHFKIFTTVFRSLSQALWFFYRWLNIRLVSDRL